MKATFQLNIEKLEYNYQVLTKREEENLTLLNANKRKITRLTDVVNGLKSKLAKQEKQYDSELNSANDDYNRLLEQYHELRKKCQLFEAADRKKMREIGKLNEDAALELVRKVLLADKIIHEQLLGLSWENPTLGVTTKDTPTKQARLKEAFGGDRNSSEADAAKDSLAEVLWTGKGTDTTIRRVMDILCDEAGFLVDSKLQVLLRSVPHEEQSLLKLDCIFKALGVETVSDIERLASFFILTPSTDQRSATETAAREPELIQPHEVTKAVRRFMEAGVVKPEETALGKARNNKSMKQQNAAGNVDFWESLSGVLSEDKLQLWETIYRSMQKYNKVLTERWNLWQEISTTEKQNRELKQLLRSYFTASVNDDLVIPPTTVLLERLHTSQ
ncbi:hypothetical protein HDU93_004127 [Gonapodya sp. JEL0774]|nr:hypothetical protein HDU93_004127 [Gonapodya sp. JEL0774]